MQFTRAQDGTESTGGGFDKSKMFVGGNLGLAFGYSTIINVAPQVGYRFTEHFAAGVGLNYSYYSYDDGGYNNFKQTYLGMSLFGRVYPMQQFFIQVQPELNYMWGNGYYPQNDPYQNSKVNQFVPSLLLGGGAAIPTGGNGALTISVMYDVIQNVYSLIIIRRSTGLVIRWGFNCCAVIKMQSVRLPPPARLRYFIKQFHRIGTEINLRQQFFLQKSFLLHCADQFLEMVIKSVRIQDVDFFIVDLQLVPGKNFK